jgi:Ca-activated chloride channel family protein
VAIGAPVDAAHGLDPAQPTKKLEYPEPSVVAGLIDHWALVRKGARVMLVIDVSGSMGDEADPKTGDSKLTLAVKAAKEALNQFQSEDQVGLWTFSTDIGPAEHSNYRELAPVAPIGATKQALTRLLDTLVPTSGTPLYEVTCQAHGAMDASYDAELINAVIVLSDGQDDSGRSGISEVRKCLGGGEGDDSTPVRVFTIAYGKDADTNAMRAMAEATNGAFYDATDPETIVDVLNAVVSNF